MFVLILCIFVQLYVCQGGTDDILGRLEALEQANERNLQLEARLRKQEMYTLELEHAQTKQAQLVERQQETIAALQARLDAQLKTDTQGNVREVRQSAGIAFTAYLNGDMKSIGAHQAIVFNSTLTNIGNAYNPITGIFLVPESGTYLFTFSICGYGPSQVIARLVVDGDNKIDAIVDPQHAHHDAQGGNSVILHVNAGQSVWIESLASASILHSSNIGRFSSFTGMMLP